VMTNNRTFHVAVFGATGKIGRHVVDQLLSAGHTVTAYVRNPSKLAISHPNLTVVEGELDDRAGVARAVDGADAVISALGPTLRRGGPALRSPTAPAPSSRRCRPPASAGSSGWQPRPSPTHGTGRRLRGSFCG
jgi:uncharacterized protein YbjT (DUF2867 family)